MRVDVAANACGDLAIARRCAQNDEAAIRLVTASNNQRLFRAAWSILKDRCEAEDAVQSTYLKAFASVHLFEGRAALSTWLTRIAINEALGRARSLARRRAALAAEGVMMLDDYRPPARPDETVAREQLRRMIEGAVSALPDTFRTVFVLRDVEGLSTDETAEILEIPVATVKTRLLRARRKLKQALAPEVRSALVGTFPFAGADCGRMTQNVIEAHGRSVMAADVN
jgi:RNA polymerase sigma-70 factor (ECF subfamily)